jgi:hypothetical protein
MGLCILSVFQYTRISNKMQRCTDYLYLENALRVSGGTSTHHQERIQLYLQCLVFVTPLLLSAAIVEELEWVSVCCGWSTPPTAQVVKSSVIKGACLMGLIIVSTDKQLQTFRENLLSNIFVIFRF